VDGFHGAGS